MADEWQDVIVGVTTRELIELGHLSTFQVFAPSLPDLSGVEISRGDYQTNGAAAVMSGLQLVGDVLKNFIAHGEGRPTLGFAVNVAHARRMAEEFNAAGIPTAFIDANTESPERQDIQEAFRSGQIRVIWSVRTMTTGVDLPVSGIIDAAPTRSTMLHQQKIGRGLRINPGTEDLMIWDHAGNTLRLGFVDDLDWSKLPAKGGPQPNAHPGDAAPQRCSSCHAVTRRGESDCRACGGLLIASADAVEAAEGELSLLAREITGRKASLAEKQSIYSQLLGLGREQGNKSGAAFYQYRDLFGTAPPSRLKHVAKKPTAKVREYVRARAAAYARATETSGAA
jgi:superfamily II DNA or RNA helicase